MAVREITYSREYIRRDDGSLDIDDLAVQGKITNKFGFKTIGSGAYEGGDGSQQYDFYLNSIGFGERNSKYTSSVRIRKCGDEQVIQKECDLERFLKEVGFLPRTS
jgi:hypothetical protein